MTSDHQVTPRPALAAALKAARKAARLSQGELASALGLHKQTLSNYERGTRVPDANVLARIAELTRCDVRKLVPPSTEALDPQLTDRTEYFGVDPDYMRQTLAETRRAGLNFRDACKLITDAGNLFGFDPGEDAITTLANRLIAGDMTERAVVPLIELLRRIETTRKAT